MNVFSNFIGHEIKHSGLSRGLIIFIIIISIILMFYYRNKNYISTTNCKITNIPNSPISVLKQKLEYDINNIKYTKIVDPITTNKPINYTDYGNITYAHPEGNCILYYASGNPDDYAVNSNPAKDSQIFIITGFVLLIVYGTWNYFTHKETSAN